MDEMTQIGTNEELAFIFVLSLLAFLLAMFLTPFYTFFGVSAPFLEKTAHR